MDGYIRRDESEQQLLIYVPDPDTVKTTREKLVMVKVKIFLCRPKSSIK